MLLCPIIPFRQSLICTCNIFWAQCQINSRQLGLRSSCTISIYKPDMLSLLCLHYTKNNRFIRCAAILLTAVASNVRQLANNCVVQSSRTSRSIHTVCYVTCNLCTFVQSIILGVIICSFYTFTQFRNFWNIRISKISHCAYCYTVGLCLLSCLGRWSDRWMCAINLTGMHVTQCVCAIVGDQAVFRYSRCARDLPLPLI